MHHIILIPIPTDRRMVAERAFTNDRSLKTSPYILFQNLYPPPPSRLKLSATGKLSQPLQIKTKITTDILNSIASLTTVISRHSSFHIYAPCIS